MKKLLTLLALTSIWVSSFSQKTDTKIFNGVTKIIVENNLSATENYKLAGQTLLDLNYNIGAKDAEFFQISSEPIKVTATGTAHMLSLYAVCKDNKITITGKTKNLSSIKIVGWQDNDSPIEIIPYKKLRELSRNIYIKVDEFAKNIKGHTIIYSE